MKKYLLLFIICAVFISGCSSSDYMSGGNYNMAMPAPAGEIYFEEESWTYYDVDAVQTAGRGTELSEFLQMSVSPEKSPQSVQRKIIKNADVNIEAPDVEQAYENILRELEFNTGYEASKNTESWGDYTYIRAELKVPADFLDDFLRVIAQEGDIRSQNIYSSDITDQYYDFQTRLLTLEKTLVKYYEFLDNARNVEEQLQVSSYISDLTYQIESLKGSINRWDFLTAYSNVSIYIYKTPEDELRVIEWSSLSFDDMGYLIKSGFVGVSSFIVNMFQRIFIALIAGSPVIIPVAAIIFILIRRAKIKRNRKRIERERAALNSDSSEY